MLMRFLSVLAPAATSGSKSRWASGLIPSVVRQGSSAGGVGKSGLTNFHEAVVPAETGGYCPSDHQIAGKPTPYSGSGSGCFSRLA
ncbi:hypothetical protein SAMN04487976_104287 [Xaviernesmea oryzae]|nr:hypothetical protein SAMN04487976_104287 [Xaviernesmea oryzae]